MKQNIIKKIALILTLVLVCSAMLTGCGQPAGEGATPTPENSSSISGDSSNSAVGSQNTPAPSEEPEVLPSATPDAGLEDDASIPEQDTPAPSPTAPGTSEETPAPSTPSPKPTTSTPNTTVPTQKPAPTPTPAPTQRPTPTPAPSQTPAPTPTPTPVPTPTPTPTPDNSQDTSSGSTSLSGTTLQVHFGDDGAPFTMHLYDNDTADKIAEYVGTADWRLPIYNYEGYDNWEVMQYYDIPSRYDIPSNPQRVTSVAAGTVYYSDPNRIVLFFGDAEVSSEYTPIGYITYSQDFVDAVQNNPVQEGWGNKIVNISDD